MNYFNSIPDDWRLVTLSELGEVNRGRSRHRPRDASHLYDGPYPFIQTGDIKSSNGRIFNYSQSYSEAGLLQSRLWPAGTMCITIAANIAETGILTFPACFPDSVIGFIADEEKCNVYFIEYVFRLLRKSIQAQASGSVQDNINLQTLERLRFPIPSLPLQNKIADLLNLFEDKITLNRQMNQTLEEMARAVFKSVVLTDVKVPFLDYVELNPRLSIKKDSPAKFIEMRDLPEQGPSIENFAIRPFSSGMKFQQNDTLLARITPCLENGKTAFVDLLEGDEIAHGSTEFIVMRARPGISPYYVYLLARETDFREHAIKSMVGTSGRQRVQNNGLVQFKLNQIEPEDMLRFHQLVQPLFQQMKNNVDQSRTLAELRDSLLPKLMKGEIPV